MSGAGAGLDAIFPTGRPEKLGTPAVREKRGVGRLARYLRIYLAIEGTVLMLATAEFLVAAPLAAYARFHTFVLFPAFVGLLVVPRSMKMIWKFGKGDRAISEVLAAVVLVLITLGLAAGLYLLLVYYTGGHP